MVPQKSHTTRLPKRSNPGAIKLAKTFVIKPLGPAFAPARGEKRVFCRPERRLAANRERYTNAGS
jgi:hypothetical protein